MNIPVPSKPIKPPLNSKNTLDVQHTIHQNEFAKKNDRIQIINKKIAAANKHIKTLEDKKRTKGLSENEFTKLMTYRDEVVELTEKIAHIRETQNEIDYYTQTAPLLFRYYDIIENGNAHEDSTCQ